METYFTFRNTVWLLALLPWPAFILTRLVLPDFDVSEYIMLAAFLAWMGALSYSPKAVLDERKRRLRLKNGACLRCGYNLKGTLDAAVRHCPECGDDIPAWRITLHANRTRPK